MDVSSSQRENRSASPSTSSSEAKSLIDEASVTHFKTFKHIPVRMYKADSLLALRLVKPTKTCDNGQERLSTLQDLLEDYFPDQEVKEGNIYLFFLSLILPLMSVSCVRGHSTTTWTEFCHFFTPAWTVFYTLFVGFWC